MFLLRLPSIVFISLSIVFFFRKYLLIPVVLCERGVFSVRSSYMHLLLYGAFEDPAGKHFISAREHLQHENDLNFINKAAGQFVSICCGANLAFELSFFWYHRV